MNAPKENSESEKKLNFLQTLGSVLAAAAGIQSRENRERDFKQGKARNFIVVGIAFTLSLIIGLYLVVRLVLSQAGI